MKLTVFFDGSCRPVNPGGTAAWGFLVKDEANRVIHRAYGVVGRGPEMSNNVGEYQAVIEAMKFIEANHPEAEVEFCGDSAMVIQQLSGEGKAKKGLYLPYYRTAKSLLITRQNLKPDGWSFKWIARAFNSEADELSQIGT